MTGMLIYQFHLAFWCRLRSISTKLENIPEKNVLDCSAFNFENILTRDDVNTIHVFPHIIY